MRALEYIAAVAAIFICVSAHAAECPFERAVFTPIEDLGFGTMKNYEWFHTRKKVYSNQSKFVATIRASAENAPHKTVSYDFSFSFTNGYGGTKMTFNGTTAKSASFRPKEGTNGEANGPGSEVIYFNEKMETVEPLAEDNPIAPAFLIAPDIGRNFWYWKSDDRSFVPSGTMWKFTSCRNP